MGSNYRKLKKSTVVLLQAGLILFALILFFSTNIEFWKSSDKSVKFNWPSNIISFATFFIPVLWQIFDNWLWKVRWIHKLFRLSKHSPILAGRWEGAIDRNEEGEHPFVIEIRQTFTYVSCKTFSQSSSQSSGSKSRLAEILYDYEHNIADRLFYFWEGKRMIDGSSKETFFGITILNISYSNDNDMILEGEYFTSELPHQTRGKIKVFYDGKKLFNRFDK